jgi:hypothetical protein
MVFESAIDGEMKVNELRAIQRCKPKTNQVKWTYKDSVAMVTAQCGKVEPALPRLAVAARTGQSRTNQTQPVGGSQSAVVRAVAYCSRMKRRAIFSNFDCFEAV